MLFKEVISGSLLHTIDELTKEPESLKHNPRFVIVTDYETVLAKDMRTGMALDTPILEIHKHFGFFLPWAGQEKYSQTNENYADRKASYKMAKLYDILVTENPNIYDDGGHNLNIFLSRLLFCFFAEDTDIFPIEGMFTETLGQYTHENGSDVNTFLDRLFTVLNTEDNRDDAAHFSEFPYVNGGLFRDTIISPKFNKEARKIIIECGDLNWSEINPDIFGSMIQAVVNPAYRSGLGMHYTSVPNIMKVIEPLFLNELYEEFEKQKDKTKKLRQLIYRISKLKIFDPACGSGNFLIIAYKELRKLEIQIWQQINELEPQYSFVFTEIKLSQFYGIELDDFAHEMAILSLWLAEHQMNKLFVDELLDFGKAKPILPLKEAGHITQGNATRLDWEVVCPKTHTNAELAEVYVLGNPPYLGYSMQEKSQKEDIAIVFNGIKNHKSLDYISCWFYKGAKYISKTQSQMAFVSTNSICQGEHVSLLWPHLFNCGVDICFVYNSFKWTNNAKGNAGVIVIIVGLKDVGVKKSKYLFNEQHKVEIDNITPYLAPGNNMFVYKRQANLSKLPEMIKGSGPTDGGNLILSKNEKETLLKQFPKAVQLIKRYYGAREYIRDEERYCLWINEENLSLALESEYISSRIEKVKQMRFASTKLATRNLANKPFKFAEIRHRTGSSIILPRVSSERREYIPIGFLDDNAVISDSAQAIYNSELWIFGLVSSRVHMVWVRTVGGRLKTDYRYSSQLCYNTFPFPDITQKQKEQINLHVFEVLGEREKHSGKTLAQLYDPDKMPKGLKEAHHQLDLAIERCYRLKPFTSDTERLEYLFKEYEKMVNKNTLLEKPKRIRKTKKA